MSAPHLPPKSCHVKAHYAVQSLPWLLLIILVAALTSTALSFASIVWLYPAFSPGEFITTAPRRGNTPADFDPATGNKIRQRIWHLYDTRQKIGGAYYRTDTPAVSAAMFSSDGWAVAYAPAYSPGTERFWEGVDYQGTSYAIERVVRDSVSSLLYIKFVGEGFPFVNFADGSDILRGSTLWSFGRADWQGEKLDTETLPESTSFDISKPAVSFVLSTATSPGNLLVNDRGELAGVADANRQLIPGWLVEEQYVAILQDGQTKYSGFPWRGFMVEGLVGDTESSRRRIGFYVGTSPTRATSSTVGVADVVTAIGGTPVSPETLAEQVLTAPDPATITVLRQGKEIQLRVRKVKVE